jgi:hypothetical protein
MGRVWVAALALALFTAAMWFAWLGWDHEYYLVDGVAQGPYRAWQVIGCGVTIVTATVAASLWAPRASSIVVLAGAAVTGFAVPWVFDASSDDTGMWVVGLMLLAVGGGLGLGLVLLVTDVLVKSERSATRDLVVCGALTVLALLVFAPAAVVPLAATAFVFFRRWLPDRRRAQL